jgi:uncharacterized membrane protein YcaP (DUF421 family)
MDPVRIVVRVLFVYVVALALIRVSGKRAVKQGDLTSFVVAIILGDMFDDAFWAEVPMSEFVVGAGTLLLMHSLITLDIFSRGMRTWQRALSGAKEPA